MPISLADKKRVARELKRFGEYREAPPTRPCGRTCIAQSPRPRDSRELYLRFGNYASHGYSSDPQFVDIRGGAHRRCDEDALGESYGTAAAFEQLEMAGYATFVHLDLVQELLRRQDGMKSRVHRASVLFTAAGVTIASITALDYLRQTVERREASAVFPCFRLRACPTSLSK